MMIEVTGSANKASSALDKVISKLLTLQQTFDKVTPALDKFTAKMDSIAKSSKAIVTLKSLTDNVNKNTLAAANAESKIAMYQARLDRANVSMERSRVSSLKLVEAQKKLKEASNFDIANKQFLDNFKFKGHPNTPRSVKNYSIPVSNVPSMDYNTQKIQQEIDNFASKVSNKKEPLKVDTTQAVESIKKVQAYIDSIRPSISRMSQEAQVEFNKLSTELIRVTNQINNQNLQYRKLAQAATQAARAHGEGSSQYLKAEKQMLTLDGQTDKLIATQDKLKSQMSNFNVAGVDKYTTATKRATKQTNLFGREASKASRRAVSGFQKTLIMMKNMFIRIIAFRLFSMLSKSITDGMNNIAQASDNANKSISAMRTSTLYLKNSLASAFMPVVQSLTPIITQLVDALAGFFNMVAMLNARIFGGATSVTIAKRASVDYAASIAKTGSSAKNTRKEIKELQRSIMGFDELNILSKQSSASPSSAGVGSGTPGMPNPQNMFKTVKIPDWVNKIGEFTDPIKKVISNWWDGLTDAQRWGAGMGAVAGTTIGGIIGHLICPGIGTVLGMMLGGVIGTVIGAWWAGLTTPEKWAAGIGAGAGIIIGGIIGFIIGGPMGAKIGVILGGISGGIIGKWWSDLTNSQKWSTGIGAGAGTIIGGIIGGLIGGPMGVAIGTILGGTAGTVIGKWWDGLTSKDKWAAGIGAGAGTVIGGIIGHLICPGLGTVLGAALGGTLGTIVASNWEKIKNWFSQIGKNIKEWCLEKTTEIGEIFKDGWNKVVSFFTVEIPKWIKSVGDWFNQLPYKIGLAVGTAFKKIVDFGKNVWNWANTQLPKIITSIVDWFAKLPGNIWKFLCDVVKKVILWGKNLTDTAKNEIPKFTKSVIDCVKDLPKKFYKIGEDIIKGLWNGITGTFGWLKDKVTGFCDKFLEGFHKGFDEHSPSIRFRDEIGAFIPPGITLGIEKSMPAAMSDLQFQISAMMKKAHGAISTGLKDISKKAAPHIGIPTDFSLANLDIAAETNVDTDRMFNVNSNGFSFSGKGASDNDDTVLNEEVLYRAFSRALQEMPIPKVNNFIDSDAVASRVETKIERKNRRYNAIPQY